MEFFLDTGVIAEIKEAVQLGIIEGVTTNPSLIAKTGRKQEDVIREISEIIDGPAHYSNVLVSVRFSTFIPRYQDCLFFIVNIYKL